MKKITGDLIKLFKEGEFDVIVHGCNCGNNMEDGIAKTVKEQFPAAYQADLDTVKWDHSKLGTISYARIDGVGYVVNAYTQYHWCGVGPNGGPLCEYDALRNCFTEIKKRFGKKALRFGIPAIGAARAGGDWSIISAIIDEEMEGEDVTFVEYDGYDPRGDYKRYMKEITE